ncbi:hypothetical protein [Streptomyces sp. HD]|uniref:hypothetical protein n=1 Tax=Streptomyces sp. HD TaxID=3020892 RepID=UPI00232ED2A3|nr:hypothetical protein [Streptomyces sp. HD]MDC0772337.1 hypothetical protein [Streptomyces sp. HD]
MPTIKHPVDGTRAPVPAVCHGEDPEASGRQRLNFQVRWDSVALITVTGMSTVVPLFRLPVQVMLVPATA